MAAVGLQSVPATLRDFGAHINFANLRAPPNPNTDEYEIGRASCRERVCQYV